MDKWGFAEQSGELGVRCSERSGAERTICKSDTSFDVSTFRSFSFAMIALMRNSCSDVDANAVSAPCGLVPDATFKR